jgi:hypothetical protein
MLFVYISLADLQGPLLASKGSQSQGLVKSLSGGLGGGDQQINLLDAFQASGVLQDRDHDAQADAPPRIPAVT